MLVKIVSLSSSDIHSLISSLDVELASRLSQSVDLNEYSIKLSHNAKFIVAYHGEMIVGLIAFYENIKNMLLYVPYICTSADHRRQGIGKALMETLLTYADSIGYTIELEVLKINYVAIILYRGYGFKVCSDDRNKFRMKRDIDDRIK